MRGTPMHHRLVAGAHASVSSFPIKCIHSQHVIGGGAALKIRMRSSCGLFGMQVGASACTCHLPTPPHQGCYGVRVSWVRGGKI